MYPRSNPPTDVLPVIHVDVLVPQSVHSRDALQTELHNKYAACISKKEVKSLAKSHGTFQEVTFSDEDGAEVIGESTKFIPKWHVYQLKAWEMQTETLGKGDEAVTAASIWVLPTIHFHNIWDSLIYDMNIKQELLDFVSSAMDFSRHKVDSTVVSWNRVVLLHGPPGTGKTSLCRALAQKVSIRLTDYYQQFLLYEINSHSLFSRWFSESGKLVQKMFSNISDHVSNRHTMVVVLIDEVESLSRSRADTASGADPSDAHRVVNAFLTQLDQLKRHPNVLILTTSNVTGTIDEAFIDRADIKQYIGNPTEKAIYEIYRSCVQELIQRGIIQQPNEILLHVRQVNERNKNASCDLLHVARASVGLSGRALRKVPFLAYALYLKTPGQAYSNFLLAMHNAVKKQQSDAALMKTGHNTMG